MNPAVERNVYYLAGFKLLICRTCGFALRKDVHEHFKRSHGKGLVPAEERVMIDRYAKTLELVEPQDVDYPDAPIERIPILPLHKEGKQCTKCGKYYGKLSSLKEHLRDKHHWKLREGDCWTHCVLQRFFVEASTSRFFEVFESTYETQEQSGDIETNMLELSLAIPEETATNDVLSPWLQRTGWPVTFQGIKKEILVHTYSYPESSGRSYDLGHIGDIHIEWSSEEEKQLQNILNACVLMYNFCESAVDNAPRHLLSLVNITNNTTKEKKPFGYFQNATTNQTYYAEWKRFLCFLFRVVKYRQRKLLFGVTICDDLVESLCSLLEGTDLWQKIEPLLELSITLLQQDIDDSVLLYWTAVRGISRADLTYECASNFTGKLAMIIHMAKLFLIGYAFPKSEAELKRLRKGFFIDNNGTGMGQIMSLLRSGYQFAMNEPSKCQMVWSENNNLLTHNGNEIEIPRVRSFVRQVIEQAEYLLQALLLGIEVEFNLNDVKDSLLSSKSFVGSDQLKDSWQTLLHAATVNGQLTRNGIWHPIACKEYLDKKRNFLQLLMLILHVTGGQPSRGTEITSLKHHDAAQGRNIFLDQGRLFYAIDYTKTNHQTGIAKFIPHFLPCSVEKLLFCYLVYVEPFVNLLVATLKGEGVIPFNLQQRRYIFRDDNEEKPWDSDMMRRVFKKQAVQHELPIGISAWRQIFIAITKRIIRPTFSYQETFSLQAGHSEVTNSIRYGHDKNYPANLQPDLLQRYLKTSEAAHQWLADDSNDGYEDEIMYDDDNSDEDEEFLGLTRSIGTQTDDCHLSVAKRKRELDSVSVQAYLPVIGSVNVSIRQSANDGKFYCGCRWSATSKKDFQDHVGRNFECQMASLKIYGLNDNVQY